MTWYWLDRLREYYLGALERAPEPPLVAPIAPEPAVFDDAGWAADSRVLRVPSRRSWYYSRLDTPNGLPLGITAHYTATDPGTAMGMAVRRRDHDRKEFDPPPGSWHFTVPQSGQVIQQLSIRQGAFHAGSKTARKLPIGWANHVTLGIELEGYGTKFSEHQIEMASWLWRAIIRHAHILREHAMYQHSWIDPGRRRDPGEVFMTQHAPKILDHAYS